MIVVNLFYGLKVNDSFQLPLVTICVISQSSVVHVEQEPPLLPRLDFAAAFGEEPSAAPRREAQVDAAVHSVTQRLDVRPQVKVHREEERQAAQLWGNWADLGLLWRLRFERRLRFTRLCSLGVQLDHLLSFLLQHQLPSLFPLSEETLPLRLGLSQLLLDLNKIQQAGAETET